LRRCHVEPGRLVIRCACGWEVTGPEGEVVPATIDHGQRLHNMTATPEQVLATAVSLEPEAGNRMESASSPGGTQTGR
jgi:predicted small metal-binding protein